MGLALKPLAARGLWANLHEAHIARVIGFGIIIALNPHHRIGNSKRHAIGFGVSCDQSTQIRGGIRCARWQVRQIDVRYRLYLGALRRWQGRFANQSNYPRHQNWQRQTPMCEDPYIKERRR